MEDLNTESRGQCKYREVMQEKNHIIGSKQLLVQNGVRMMVGEQEKAVVGEPLAGRKVIVAQG